MTTITNDDELIRYSARARGRVVLITGQVHIRRTSARIPFSYLCIHRWCRRISSTRSMGIRAERVRVSLPSGFVLSPLGSSSHAIPRFSCRANVVIGDILPGAQDVARAINRLPPGNGKACWKYCDVTSWEDQVALYELAMTRFGGVDIVVSVPFLGVHRWAHRFYMSTRWVRTIDRRCKGRRSS